MAIYEQIIKSINNELGKSYSHKPHLAELPHDRRSTDPDELQERIDACDEKIKETEQKIKEMEDASKYNEKIYEKAGIEQLLKDCREFIDGKYSEEKLLEAIRKDNPEYEQTAKQCLGRRSPYIQLIRSIESIDPTLEITPYNKWDNPKSNPLSLENLPDWYNDSGFGQAHSELQWISGMLTTSDHDGGGTHGPPGADMVPWTRDLRHVVERTGNPLWRDARNHAHKTGREADRASTVLWRASKEKAETTYSSDEINHEKTKLKDYKEEKKRTEERKATVSKKD